MSACASPSEPGPVLALARLSRNVLCTMRDAVGRFVSTPPVNAVADPTALVIRTVFPVTDVCSMNVSGTSLVDGDVVDRDVVVAVRQPGVGAGGVAG